MEDAFTAAIVCSILFLGMPWIIFHYVTKWKQAPKMTREDENLLDEMYTLARRLEDRVRTVERIAAADHPDWRPGLSAQPDLSRTWRPAADRQPLDQRN